MFGLNSAGKTTLFNSLDIGKVLSTMPTLFFNRETVSYKNVDLTIWDVAGTVTRRKSWSHYYTTTDTVGGPIDAIIFVVDSGARTRFPIARKELQKVLKADQLKNAKILMFANKQDLPNAAPISDVAREMVSVGVRVDVEVRVGIIVLVINTIFWGARLGL